MENINYFVTISTYDWFGGQKHETKGFRTLLEAWSFYNQNRKYDFDYGDHYQDTHKPVRNPQADVYVLPPQRPHARSKEEYESWFAPYKCEPFFRFKQVSSFDDVKDVEVVETEKEYFFDNDELLF